MQEGDTLSGLAERFGVSKETLVGCNEYLAMDVEEPVSGIQIWKPRKGTAEGDPEMQPAAAAGSDGSPSASDPPPPPSSGIEAVPEEKS